MKTVALIALAALVAGCGTTATSRLRAEQTRQLLTNYMQERRASIEQLNRADRAVYASLVRDHAELTEQTLFLRRGADAAAIADTLLVDWRVQGRASVIRSMVEAARTRQLAGLERRDSIIADARLQYAKAHAALALDLSKLQTAAEQIGRLSVEPRAARATIDLLVALAEASRSASKPDEHVQAP